MWCSGESAQRLDAEMDTLYADHARHSSENAALVALWTHLMESAQQLRLMNDAQEMRNNELRSGIKASLVGRCKSALRSELHLSTGMSIHPNANSNAPTLSDNAGVQPACGSQQAPASATPAGVSQALNNADLPKTTLFVRNIPLSYDQDVLLQLWAVDGTFDYLYLPRNISTQKNSGHAVLNFVTQDLALAFRKRWHGHELDDGSGHTFLEVSWARAQGLTANLVQAKKGKVDRIRNPKFQPMVFHGLQRVDFLEALETV